MLANFLIIFYFVAVWEASETMGEAGE